MQYLLPRMSFLIMSIINPFTVLKGDDEEEDGRGGYN